MKCLLIDYKIKTYLNITSSSGKLKEHMLITCDEITEIKRT